MTSETILSLIIVSTTGILALICKLIYSSKCKVIRCCGNEIQRDTEHEQTINIGNQTPNNI